VGDSVWYKSWEVDPIGWWSGDYEYYPFPPDGTGPWWQSEGYVFIVGPGTAWIPTDSYVALYNGGMCYSTGPSAGFN
jgi:hypothetical protein